jgi:predicted  nucleic acid-binding Zn-ribbon protein
LELTGNPIRKGGLEDLDKEIEKLRRRLPPAVLSHYDGLTQKYADPLSLLNGDVCQGCQHQVSKRATLLAGCSPRLFYCEHCGRFIFVRANAPDYVT